MSWDAIRYQLPASGSRQDKRVLDNTMGGDYRGDASPENFAWGDANADAPLPTIATFSK